MLIRNVAEFKRAMMVGSRWEFFDSRNAGRLPTPTVRTCTHSQSNSFALNNHPNQTDKTKSSWLEYPKAKDFIFIHIVNENTQVKILMGDDNYLIYRPIA